MPHRLIVVFVFASLFIFSCIVNVDACLFFPVEKCWQEHRMIIVIVFISLVPCCKAAASHVATRLIPSPHSHPHPHPANQHYNANALQLLAGWQLPCHTGWLLFYFYFLGCLQSAAKEVMQKSCNGCQVHCKVSFFFQLCLDTNAVVPPCRMLTHHKGWSSFSFCLLKCWCLFYFPLQKMLMLPWHRLIFLALATHHKTTGIQGCSYHFLKIACSHI